MRVDRIDPFHGVDGMGSCLPGPYLPLGQCRPGPDTLNPAPTGYASGQPLLRFSHTHVNGTGGEGRYGNIGVVPLPSRHGINPFAFQVTAEEARVGVYRAELSPGPVTAELTATAHGALHRYSFSGDAGLFGLGRPHIVLETQAGVCAQALDGEIRWTAADTCEGFGTLRGGWGHDEPYTVYFSARFRQTPERTHVQAGTERDPVHFHGVGATAVAVFPCESVVELEVGISYVGVEAARKHREAELDGKSFEELVEAARTAWEARLETLGADSADHRWNSLYATLVYRLFSMPDDLGRDECPWFPNRRRQFNNFYCLWDSVRNANSLFALWDPALETDICMALLEIADHTGWIPDAWIMGHRGAVQGGCSADTLFAEAALKRLPGFDAEAALSQMLRERDTPSADPKRTGRYPGYAERGWLDDSVPQCLSRSIEYSFQEENLARLAEERGQPELAAAARARSRKLLELWDSERRCFAPKTADGGWSSPFDPWRPQRLDYWADPHCYEGTGHEWSLCAVHLIPELIERHGGPEGFVAHLDEVFERGFFLWKEIVLHVPWLYHYAGRPDLSASRVRECLEAHYRPGRAGLTDNEDMGSQSSFAIASLCGVYPVPGTDLYLLLPPVMDTVDWRVGPEGVRLRVRKDPELKGLTWNGAPHDRSWIRHAELLNGGELVCGPVETWKVGAPPAR